MQITDPVADMLTRIRNANSAKHETVDVPASNLKKAMAQILLDEGYIKAYSIVGQVRQMASRSSAVKLAAERLRIFRRPTPKYTASAPPCRAAVRLSHEPHGAIISILSCICLNFLTSSVFCSSRSSIQ